MSTCGYRTVPPASRPSCADMDDVRKYGEAVIGTPYNSLSVNGFHPEYVQVIRVWAALIAVPVPRGEQGSPKE